MEVMIWMNVAHLLSALRGNDDVELVRAVDWSRESSSVRIVRVADVRDDSVKHDVRVLRDWSDVVRQSDEERHSLSSWRRSA